MLDFRDMQTSTLRDYLHRHVDAEVRFDATTRRLYSTDASIYQIEPLGVVIPRTPQALVAAVQIALEARMPITPRGGGTSLSGQSIGPGIVLDCSKYLNSVLDIDPAARDRANSARRRARPVQPGAVALWPAVRPRRVHRQPGQPRRHDRQQLRRGPLHRLRQDHRPRPSAARGSRRRQPGRIRPAGAVRMGAACRSAIRSKAPSTGMSASRQPARRRDSAPLSPHPAPGQRLQPRRLAARRTVQSSLNLLVGSEGTLAVIAEAELIAGPRAAGARPAGAAVRLARRGDGRARRLPGIEAVRGRTDGSHAARSGPQQPGSARRNEGDPGTARGAVDGRVQRRRSGRSRRPRRTNCNAGFRA